MGKLEFAVAVFPPRLKTCGIVSRIEDDSIGSGGCPHCVGLDGGWLDGEITPCGSLVNTEELRDAFECAGLARVRSSPLSIGECKETGDWGIDDDCWVPAPTVPLVTGFEGDSDPTLRLS